MARRSTGIETEDDDTVPILSMRVKVTAGGLCFLVCMVIVAGSGMPHLVSALQGIRGTRTLIVGEEPVVIGLGWLQHAEISPDGRLLATCSDTALQIWHLNGSLATSLPARDGIPWAGLGWSPHGTMIAVSDYLGRVIVLRGSDLSVVSELDYDHGRGYDLGGVDRIEVRPLKWSPNGSLLAFSYADNKAHIYDVATHGHVTSLYEKAPDGGIWPVHVKTIDWSPDGKRLLRNGHNSTLVQNVSTWEIIHRLDEREQTFWHNDAAVFSPDGTMIATLNRDWQNVGPTGYPEPYLNLYKTESGVLEASARLESNSACLAWSPDGKLVAVGTTKGSILLFRSNDVSIVSNISAHSSEVASLSWRGSYLASASQDQTVKLWNLDQSIKKPVRTFRGWGSGVKRVEWFPDGESVLTCHVGRHPVRVYMIDGHEELHIDDPDAYGSFLSATVSPDGKMIATSTGGPVSIWDSKFGALATRLDIEGSTLCKWNPAKPGILAVAKNQGVEIWDVSNPRAGPLVEVAKDQRIRCVEWSPQGDLLALGYPSRIEIWDPSRPVSMVSVETWTYVNSLAWSPNDLYIASLAVFEWELDRYNNPPPPECPMWTPYPAKLEVWYIHRGVNSVNLSPIDYTLLLRPIDGTQNSLAWAPNSSMLAVATGSPELLDEGYDPLRYGPVCGVSEPGMMILRVGHYTGVSPVANFTGPVRPVSSVSWSPDGSKVVAGGDDGTIRIWKVGPESIPGVIGSPVLCLVTIVIVAILINLRRSRHNAYGH